MPCGDPESFLHTRVALTDIFFLNFVRVFHHQTEDTFEEEIFARSATMAHLNSFRILEALT
jgi:hypothetical protein